MKPTWILLATLAACSKPEPPVLRPDHAAVTAVTPTGVELQIVMDALNNNKSDLSARSVKARVKLDGKYDLGEVVVDKPITLPAGQHTNVTVPLSLKWNDLTAVVTMGASDRPVPYSIDGSVNLGGDLLNVDVPYHMDGAIPHDQIVRATVNSLPRMPNLR